MNIGIIGAGHVGSVLARRLTEVGHQVTVSASSAASQRLAEAAAASGAVRTTPPEAAAFGEVVILAVPFPALEAALTDEVVDALAGKIVVDVTNPLAADFMSLVVGHTTSAGEQVAALLPQASVVKAFNTILAPNHGKPVLGGMRQFLPVAGNDAAAKKTILDLGTQLGFDAVDAGPITNARYLEPVTELLIQLAYRRGMGTSIGFALARD